MSYSTVGATIADIEFHATSNNHLDCLRKMQHQSLTAKRRIFNHTIYKKVAQQADPVEVVSQPNPVTIRTDVVDNPQPPKKEFDQPIAGTEKIIMRADSILNSEKSCHKKFI